MSIEDPQGGDRWHTGEGRLRKGHELELSQQEQEELKQMGHKKQIQKAEQEPQIFTDFPWMADTEKAHYDPNLDPKNFRKE